MRLVKIVSGVAVLVCLTFAPVHASPKGQKAPKPAVAKASQSKAPKTPKVTTVSQPSTSKAPKTTKAPKAPKAPTTTTVPTTIPAPTKADAKIAKTQAKGDAKVAATEAKGDAKIAKTQAKADAKGTPEAQAKADAKIAKTEAKTDAKVAKIEAKTDAKVAKIEAKAGTPAAGEDSTTTTPAGETTTTPTTSTVDFTSGAVAEKLTRNDKLRTKLETRLAAAGYEGSAYQAAYGFKNLGQFVAATNASQRTGIPFDQLRIQMTGYSVDASGTVLRANVGPDGTVTLVAPADATNPAPTLSLGQSITTLNPSVNGTAEAQRATVQADAEISSSTVSN